jgi:chain length determinant protein tyrosine kinase EpsG
MMTSAASSTNTDSVANDAGNVDDAAQVDVHDSAIGDIIRRTRQLSAEQIEQILAHQHEHGIRFGEAAVALSLATSEDVLRALSQQFHYPYSPERLYTNAFSELIVAASPFSDEAEAFRELRSQLMMGALSTDEPRRALAVLSPDVGDGKTFVAANIAVAFSQLGGRTLLVDADLRTPRQHKVFNLGQTSGLSSILSGRTDEKAVHQVPDLPSLYLLPAGAVPPNPQELLQRPAFGLLLIELLGKFDYVVVDTPAATHGADARVVAAKCGASLVIGRRGTTRMPAIAALVKSLAKSPGVLAGVVLNDW